MLCQSKSYYPRSFKMFNALEIISIVFNCTLITYMLICIAMLARNIKHESSPWKNITTRQYLGSLVLLVLHQLFAIIAKYIEVKLNCSTETECFAFPDYFAAYSIIGTCQIIFQTTAGQLTMFSSFHRFQRIHMITNASKIGKLITLLKVILLFLQISSILLRIVVSVMISNGSTRDQTSLLSSIFVKTAGGCLFFLIAIDVLMSFKMTHKTLSMIQDSIKNGLQNERKGRLAKLKKVRIGLILFFIVLSLDYLGIILIYIFTGASFANIAFSLICIHILMTFRFLKILKNGVRLIKDDLTSVSSMTTGSGVRLNTIDSSIPSEGPVSASIGRAAILESKKSSNSLNND